MTEPKSDFRIIRRINDSSQEPEYLLAVVAYKLVLEEQEGVYVPVTWTEFTDFKSPTREEVISRMNLMLRAFQKPVLNQFLEVVEQPIVDFKSFGLQLDQ